MASAFTDATLIQSATGTAGTGSSGPTSATVTLPAGTTEGNTVVIYMRNLNFAAISDVWDTAVQQNGIPSLSIYTRMGVPAGESTWTLQAVSTSAWAWRVEEWANVAGDPYVTSTSSAAIGTSATSLASGDTASFTEQFVMGIGAFSFYKGSSDGQVWPTISYSGSWTLVDAINNGTGVANGDQRIEIIRYYGTENETGPFSTTGTFTGACTNISSQSALLVLRAADQVIVPAPTFMSGG